MFWAPMDLKLALAGHVSLGGKCLNGVEKAQFIHHAPQRQRAGQSNKDGGHGGLSGLGKDWGN